MFKLLCVAFTILTLLSFTEGQMGQGFYDDDAGDDPRFPLTFAGLIPLTGSSGRVGAEVEAACRAAVQFLINVDPSLSAFFRLRFEVGDTGGNNIQGVKVFEDHLDRTAVYIGPMLNDVAEVVANSAAGFQYAVLSYAATRATLSDMDLFPTFSRMVPPEDRQGIAIAELVDYLGWNDFVTLVYTSDSYGISLSDAFLSSADRLGITVNGKILVQKEQANGFDEIADSIRLTGGRVIVAFMPVEEMQNLLISAERYEMLTDNYVWIGADSITNSGLWHDLDGQEIPQIKELARGMIGTRYRGGTGDLYEQFLDLWETLDPEEYPGAGDRTVTFWAPFAIDCLSLSLRSINYLLITAYNVLITGESADVDVVAISTTIRNVVMAGLTGTVNLHGSPSRSQYPFEIVNLRYGDQHDDFDVVGYWVDTPDDYGQPPKTEYDIMFVGNSSLPEPKPGLTMEYRMQFRGGSYNLPDLWVRNSLTYWSCDDKEEKEDKSGKSVVLDPPTGNGNIALHYRCDQFIDCENMSDEWGCSGSIPLAMLIYGIIVIVFIIVTLIFLVFIVIFSFIIPKKRVRAASPMFLIIAGIACLLGYLAIFAWYGKPHTVGCSFQPWLVSIPLIIIVSALFVKTFRVWRLYHAKKAIKPLSDWQLLLAIAILSLPVILINFLWTLLATPTASLQERDGYEHVVCHSGGFVGSPLGYVFFALLVAYFALVLLFGVFLSFVTRNVSSAFNESRVIGLAIYNLTFLGVVVIPLYFALFSVGPLVVWIILMSAILYGFFSTMALQLVPKVWGVIVVDGIRKDTVGENYSSSGTETGMQSSSSSTVNSMFAD